MASTPTGRALTEAHRLAQIALSKTTVRDFLAVWKLLDPAALNASFPSYARAARLVIDANRAKSSGLALAYLDAFRRAEGVTEPLTGARAAALPEVQATTSLTVTGPVKVYAGLRAGKPIDAAMTSALVLSTQAVLRHALNGGRETITRTVERDTEADGLVRVTDADPCYYCARMAARGVIRRAPGSDLTVRSHDGCACMAEPAYLRDDYTPPGRSQEFAEIEARAEVTDDDRSTKDPGENAFRRLYNASR